MTLGEFREKTKHLPDELVIISDFEGYGLCEISDARKMSGFASTDVDGRTDYLDKVYVNPQNWYPIDLLFLDSNL